MNRAAHGPRRSGRAPAVLAALVLTLVTALVAPAAAQTTAPGPPTTAPADPGAPRIALAGQDPWTPVGGEVQLELAVANSPAGATVSFTAYQALTSRKQYDAVVVGGPPTTVLSQFNVPLDLLEVDDSGNRTVRLALPAPNDARDPGRLNIRRPGVYPLDVDLRDGDDNDRSSFRTMLVVSEADRATVAEPLGVAWVWPITAPPSFLPGGEPDREVVSTFRADGRLGRMAAALRAVPEVPVTLAPTAETLEAWDTTAGTDPTAQITLDALRSATANRAVLDGPFVPVDLPSLIDYGLTGAVDDVLARGSATLQASFGATLDRRTRVLRPASPAALGRLHAGGVDRVVVTSDALAPGPETRFTLAQPVTLPAPLAGGGTAPVTALVTDPGLQSILTADLPAAQRVQLLLGGLALVALETPAIGRVVTLLNPDDFDAPSALYEGLLTGLRDNPFLRPVTAGQAFDTIPVTPPAPTVNASDATAERSFASVATSVPSVTDAAYRNQRLRLGSYTALTRPGDPAVTDGDRALLAAVASGWPIDIGKARAEAHLGVVDHVINTLVGRIEVPDPRTITLTSRSGEIPLTFRNETGYPVRLRASLASEKLFFPEGAVLDILLPERSTTVRVAVEARTSGTFPLDLEVTSTDGVLSISQRRLEVRSTFVSTVGVVLMASAVAFLALWWGLDLRRRRRRRRQPSTT